MMGGVSLIVNVFYFSHLVIFFSYQHQNQLILGEMWIDVSHDDIKKLTPRFTVSQTHPCVITCMWTNAFITPSFVTCSVVKNLLMFPYGAISVRFDSNMSSTNKNSFVIDYVYFRPCLGPLKPFFKLFHNHYHGLAIMPHMSCHKVIIIGFSGHKH